MLATSGRPSFRARPRDSSGALQERTLPLADAEEPLSSGGATYVNYLNDDASPGEIKQAYGGEKYRRLRELKAKYDPENVFRYNQNIPPA